MIRAAGDASALAGSMVICLALLITVLVGMRDKSGGEPLYILCSYERRAHEAWALRGEVGAEPSLGECE